jgi:hypothetical protein
MIVELMGGRGKFRFVQVVRFNHLFGCDKFFESEFHGRSSVVR